MGCFYFANDKPHRQVSEVLAFWQKWELHVGHCIGTDSPSTEGDKNKPPSLVLYDYQASRCARDYLKNFRSYLPVDVMRVMGKV